MSDVVFFKQDDLPATAILLLLEKVLAQPSGEAKLSWPSIRNPLILLSCDFAHWQIYFIRIRIKSANKLSANRRFVPSAMSA